MPLSRHFALTRPRSSDFGHYISDFRRFHTIPLALRLRVYRFLCDSEVDPLSLATNISSLANVSRIKKQS